MYLGPTHLGCWNLRVRPFVAAFNRNGVTLFWNRGRGYRLNWTWSR
jgi:hypothetical protein